MRFCTCTFNSPFLASLANEVGSRENVLSQFCHRPSIKPLCQVCNYHFEHNDAQGLLTNFSGKGKAANNMTVGSPGYRERIDFGEFIGYYIPENDKTLKIPTSKGIIHYSKSGAHIIPANPEGL